MASKLEHEYKMLTGYYPKKKAYGNVTKSQGIFIPQEEAEEYSNEMQEYGFINIPSKAYVDWLEDELIKARDNGKN